MPHSAAGMRTDPPVSEPMPPGASRAATATPVPPLDAPGMRSRRVRIARRAEGGVVVGDAVGELVQIAFAEHDGAGVEQRLHDTAFAFGRWPARPGVPPVVA